MTALRRHSPTLLLGLLLAAILFALQVGGVYTVFTSKYPGANDFYSRWGGARAFWVNGLNPYSEEATRQIQQGIYGRAVKANEDPGPFAYPFYVAILIWPLVYLPYAWASAIWLSLLQTAILAAFFLTLSLYRWRPPLWLTGFSAVWMIIFYHSARTIILGQIAGLVYFGLALSLWAISRRAEAVAGIALAFCTIKPQMVYLVIPLWLWWGWRQKQWRFLGYFGATMGLLAGLSFLLLPTWLLDFLRQLATYRSYQALGYINNIGSPVWIISHIYLPFLGDGGEMILAAVLLLGTAYAWWYYRNQPQAFYWLIGLALLTTNLITPRAATTNYLVLLLPLFLFFVYLSRRVRYGNPGVFVIQLAGLIGSWWLFWATLEGNLEGPLPYLPLPLLVGGILWWYRRQLMAESPGL